MGEYVFRIALANRSIEIHSIHEEIYKTCKDYLLSGQDNEETDILITLSNEDILSEKQESFNSRTGIQAEQSIYFKDSYFESLVGYRKICEEMPAFNTFLMHGSIIACEGWGYMFIAPSGVGKTTRTRLWLKEYPHSFVINGDKPLLKVDDDYVYAFGTPWSGKENWNTNASIRLRAIFMLERVQSGEKSSIRELRLAEAFPYLMAQTYQPRNMAARRKILSLLKAVGERVRVYNFRSECNGEAIRLAYESTKPNED